jgi:hypothetical protein
MAWALGPRLDKAPAGAARPGPPSVPEMPRTRTARDYAADAARLDAHGPRGGGSAAVSFSAGELSPREAPLPSRGLLPLSAPPPAGDESRFLPGDDTASLAPDLRLTERLRRRRSFNRSPVRGALSAPISRARFSGAIC